MDAQLCNYLSMKKILILCLVGALLSLVVQPQRAAAQTIVFPHENVSDLRGLLNVFHTFRQACLTQPTNSDLPVGLAPAGYGVFSHNDHLWGEQTGASTEKSAVVSRTGSEQGDWDGGHIIIQYFMPKDNNPDGSCTVKWKRAWDYEEGQAEVALGMHGVFDAQISFHLKAVLISRPDDSFSWKQKTYVGVNDWYTPCLDRNWCKFKVFYQLDPESGIDMSISREAVQK